MLRLIRPFVNTNKILGPNSKALCMTEQHRLFSPIPVLANTNPLTRHPLLDSEKEELITLPPPQKMTHYKGGEYAIIGEGIHTETEEELVFYYCLKDLKLYARPKEMFYSDVEYNGVTMKRFIQS